jgi:hypothetical protein
LFSSTCNQCSFLQVRHHISYLFKRTGKVAALCLSLFCLLQSA